MRIGELSKRTGSPARMLRYYEDQGLLNAERSPNGYRDYSEDSVARVEQVRGLIDSGVPSAIIRQLLPCLDSSDDLILHDNCPEILEMLERQRDDVSARIDCLTRNRDAITDYVEQVRAVRA